MRILCTVPETVHPEMAPSEKLSRAENERLNGLMTTLFRMKVLEGPEAGELDFLTRKRELAPFQIKPTDAPHQFELVMQAEAMAQLPLVNTPLHELVKEGTVLQVQRMLLAHPEWVNARNGRGQTPLAIAIESQIGTSNNRLEIVKLLVYAGADVRLADKDNWTPFYRASRQDRLDILEYIARLGAIEDLNQANRDAGSTPLMRMVDSHSVNGTHWLVSLGADVNAANALGTALYYAAKNGSVDLVRILCEDGNADLNKVSDPLALTPLGVALNNGHTEVADYLRARGASLIPSKEQVTPLQRLVESGDDTAILESLSRNEKDAFGRTVVHYCAAFGRLESLRKMDPAHLNEPDAIYRRAPLHYAVMLGQEESALWLATEAKCNLRQDDKAGHFPLTWAAQFGRERIARQLLKEAASRDELETTLKQVDNYGWMALHKAAKHGHLPLVKLFVEEYKMNPSQPIQQTDPSKSIVPKTALDLATEVHAEEVIRYLKIA